MQHPLTFVSTGKRRPLFLALLFWTLILFAVFRVLNNPLVTPVSPGGILSFELAGSVQRARMITNAWKEASLLLSAVAGQPNPDIVNLPYLYAAFGLGLDYLFMPSYALTIALGTLLAAGRHKGWFLSFGAIAGYGAFAAALFDAVENYALWQILLGAVYSPYPQLAAFCATFKFVLILSGIVYSLIGWLWPRM